jgi:hypothetical protein
MKFYEQPSGGTRVVTYGQTDMTRLVVAVRFPNASGYYSYCCY